MNQDKKSTAKKSREFSPLPQTFDIAQSWRNHKERSLSLIEKGLPRVNIREQEKVIYFCEQVSSIASKLEKLYGLSDPVNKIIEELVNLPCDIVLYDTEYGKRNRADFTHLDEYNISE